MARSIAEIEAELIGYKDEQPELKDLNSTSKTSIWRLIFFVVASAFQTLEQKWDALTEQLDPLIQAAKPMSLYWYKREALRFQYGPDFQYDEWGQYDNSGKRESDIAKSKIVKYVAIVRIGHRLQIKVATTAENGDLTQLNQRQKRALQAYFDDNGSAGTQIEIHSEKADGLKLEVDIYYDPIVLDSAGKRLDGDDLNPVVTAIDTYLKHLSFNGALTRTALSNAIEAVDGVEAVQIKGAWSQYGRYDYDTTGEPNVGAIDEFRTLDAGYARLDREASQFTYKTTDESA